MTETTEPKRPSATELMQIIEDLENRNRFLTINDRSHLAFIKSQLTSGDELVEQRNVEWLDSMWKSLTKFPPEF